MKTVGTASLICSTLLALTSCGLLGGKSGSGLFPVVQNQKCGYIDRKGKIVIQPQFDRPQFEQEMRFFDGLAVVRLNEKCGYINTKGEYVVNPQFVQAEKFSEGLAAVNVGKTNHGETKWGFIDTTGKMVVTPQFESASLFVEGLAPVEIGGGGKWGYIDKTGKFVINPQFGGAGFFHDGLAMVSSGSVTEIKNGVVNKPKVLFIDKTGKYISEPPFDLGGPWFHALSDTTFIMTRFYGRQPEWPEAVAVGEKIGFIDKFGHYVIDPQFYDATRFYDGTAAVQLTRDGKWTVIDTTGKRVIAGEFDVPIIFSEGLAAVKSGDKWGFIDKTGKYVINPQFDYAEIFVEGLAAVHVGSKLGYIDKSGKYVWNPTD